MINTRNIILAGTACLLLAACADNHRVTEDQSGYENSTRNTSQDYQHTQSPEPMVRASQSK